MSEEPLYLVAGWAGDAILGDDPIVELRRNLCDRVGVSSNQPIF